MFNYKVTATCNLKLEGFNENPIELNDEYKPNELKRFFKENYVSLIKEHINEDIQITLCACLRIKDKIIDKTVLLTSAGNNLEVVAQWNDSQIDLFIGSIRNQIMMHSNYDMEANL